MREGIVCPWDTAETILMGYRGSHAHGTFIPPEHPLGTDDEDWFLVTKHNTDFYLSMEGYNRKEEHYENISEDGIDILAYDVRKFIKLLVAGNPNVHSWLWTDNEDRWALTDAGIALLENRDSFISRRIFKALTGYAEGQYNRMNKNPTDDAFLGEKRRQIAARYGYNVKNAAHSIRLLIMGETLATDGVLPVRLHGDDLDIVLSIKRGEIPLENFISLFGQYREDFTAAEERCDFIREEPDWDLINEILIGEIL